MTKNNYSIVFDEEQLNLKEECVRLGKNIIGKIYNIGFIDDESALKVSNKELIVILKNGNSIKEIPFFKFTKTSQILPLIKAELL